MKTLIKNTLVADGLTAQYRADILIGDNKIAQIGTNIATSTIDEIIDGSTFIATSGMVNAHTHIGMHYFRGFANDLPLMDWLTQIWPLEDLLSDEDVYMASMAAIAEMIRSGTTTFADMYASQEAVAKAVQESGVRALLARGLIGNGPNGQKALDESEELIANWHNADEGRITVAYGPHAPYTCNCDYLVSVAQRAREKQLPLHIHLCETQYEVSEIQKEHGCSPVELLERIGFFEGNHTILAHMVHLSENDYAILQKHSVVCVHNPESNLKLASGIADITTLRKHHIAIALGTDGVSSNNTLEMWTSLRLASFLAKGTNYDSTLFPAQETWQLATANGASGLLLSNKIGTLEVGKEADIILVDINNLRATPLHDAYAHLCYSVYPDDVDTVFVRWKKLMQNKQLLTIDEEKIRAYLAKRSTELFMK